MKIAARMNGGALGALIFCLTVDLTVSHAFHPPTKECGDDPNRQTGHCYAQRVQEADPIGDGIVGVFGQIGILGDPCVPAITPADGFLGDFSATTVWLHGLNVGELRTWLEFGLIKFDDGMNTSPLRYYAYCNGCIREWYTFNVAPQRDDTFYVLYSDMPQQDPCWHVFINGYWQTSLACGVASLKGARSLRIGGETTHWDVDMGPQEYKRLLVQQWHDGIPDIWRHYSPTDTSPFVPTYSRRHWSRFGVTQSGPLITSFSRHFYYDEPSTCELQ